ncbi:MAG: PQQ-like beta-propeller repeat protein, partial [Methanomicrobiales archaeon]|nr:PQQ-like beta-propeller repeat protein [Methanomicrobiales archaeon]
MAAMGRDAPMMNPPDRGNIAGWLCPALVVLLVLSTLALPAQAQGTSPGETPLWTYTAGKSISGVAMTPDSSLVAAISDELLTFALDGKGGLLWTYPQGLSMTSVAVAPDGPRVATGGIDGKVHLLGRDGNLVWSTAVGAEVNGVGISLGGDR